MVIFGWGVGFVTFAGVVLAAWDVLDKESSPYRLVVPKIELQASPKDLPVGEQAILTLKVNTKKAAGQYHCLWEVTGVADGEKLIGGVKQDDCALRPLRNFGVAFAKGERLQALYTVALSLGLRMGEALGLRWPDIDFGPWDGSHFGSWRPERKWDSLILLRRQRCAETPRFPQPTRLPRPALST